MYSSSYCQSKIIEYGSIKSNVEDLYHYFDDCISVVNDPILTDVDEVTVNGSSILDSLDGSLSMSQISLELSDCKSKLSTIASECSSKIEEYTFLMEEAIARENQSNSEK